MADVFHWPIRVYWEDTDAGGIVFYANYLKFFERARTEWLRSLGVEQQRLKDSGGGMFVVTGTELRYHQPARLDDLLQIRTQIQELGRACLTLHQVAYRMSPEKPDTLLCEGTIRIGWVDAARMRPSRMPSAITDVFKHS